MNGTINGTTTPSTSAATAPSAATRHDGLIAVEALRALIASGAPPLIVDARFDLADPSAGEKAHAAGHLPGAFYLHLDRDLSGPKQDAFGAFRGRHPLPEREAFAARLRELGMTPGRQVVAYDAADGMYAARVWWMLRWLGHDAVAVLDGGLTAWRQAGGELSTDTPIAAPAAESPAFQPGSPLEEPMSAQDLFARLGQVRLIDARAGERFRGDVEPLDAQAGHIPGAVNRFFKTNLRADGRFKAPAELRDEFLALLSPLPAGQTVHQCGSGVTACHNLLAMHHAGLPGSRLYAGSWSEWSANPRLPLAKG
ncbi:sulfurtransferase [Roseateles aquatilis]|uniref:Sulfurtransferase n=1 Tax=Roseateles aquatilis TaxID=431061 RepID=A0A246J4W9_9BURK|nr:sulfurtransferase [Roseateles aquatilis]OWQ87623.1 sulfurtransferase [Roseateles aquatilis]